MENRKIIAKAIRLGASAGFRGVVAPALIGYFFDHHAPQKGSVGKHFIAKVLTGEKKPRTYPLNPNRLVSRHSFSKVASGAIAGAGLFKANKIGVVKGLLVGGASALAVTVASHYLQEYLHKQNKSKDPLLSAVGLLINAGNHFFNKKK